MTGLWHTIKSATSQENTVAEAVFHLLRTLSAAQGQVFAATLWSLWKHINLKVWEEKNA